MMVPSRSIGVAYLTPDQLRHARTQDRRGIIGVVRYSKADDAVETLPGIDAVRVGLPPLGERPRTLEVWYADGPIEEGRAGQVRFRANSNLLFGSVVVSEFASSAESAVPTSLEDATERAYREIFQCIEQRGFVHLWRIWNYFPEINRETGATERYRQFNSARRRAFMQARRAVVGHVPAACALGSAAGGPLTIYFLASTDPAMAIENPRQISAYDYPPQYGPASPVFSRAVLSRGTPHAALWISGTASILGHRTVHEGNVLAQTREAANNIQALVEEANRHADASRFDAGDLFYKVYLRRTEDYPICAEELRRAFGPRATMLYLNADVCRSELLVEIEGFGAAATGLGQGT